jgi:hypothetical protein
VRYAITAVLMDSIIYLITPRHASLPLNTECLSSLAGYDRLGRIRASSQSYSRKSSAPVARLPQPVSLEMLVLQFKLSVPELKRCPQTLLQGRNGYAARIARKRYQC